MNGKEALCRHCRLPVPPGSHHPEFCCAGCEFVHGTLVAAGLSRFYELGGGTGQPVGRKAPPIDLAWLPEHEAAAVVRGDTVRLHLDVQGLRCAACVWLIQELWRRRPGSLGMDLNPALGQASFLYDRRELRFAEYATELAGLGYRLAPASKRSDARDRGLLARLGVCAAIAMNVMLFALSGYLGLDAASEPELFTVFGWVSLLLATVSVLVGGPVFFRGALAGLRHRFLHLDLPISLGILLAWAGSVHAFAVQGRESYFDSLAVFVTLMVLGRFLQQRAVRRNQEYLLANDGAEHLRVRRIEGHALRSVPVGQVQRGDRLYLVPGELVPVRARLERSAGSFSLDWIQGESEPRAFVAGDVVPAGAFHAGREPALLEAQATAQESGLLRLLATPEGTREDLRGTSRFWERLNRAYAGVVLVLATLAGLAWAWIDPARALPVAIAVLVVTCPCATGIAVPLAFHLALAGLRRSGVFVRTAALLEKARAVRRVVFDKTGTLTWGELQARVLREPSGAARATLAAMAAASNHPASRAIARAVAGDAAPFREDLAVREVPGQGLEAELDGARWRLGAPRFALGETNAGGEDGLVLFTRDGHVEGCFAMEESFRAGFAQEIAALRAAGCEVHLLSGDRRAKVERAAETLGVDRAHVRAELAPEAKAAYVRAMDRGDTMMVGDGLNDAPAFEAAFCAGTPALDRPVLPARADFCFLGNGSGAVSRVLAAGHRFRAVVVANLALGFTYNVGAVAAALLGWMTPLWAAVLMPISSLTLLLHTWLRMRVPAPAGAAAWT
ncbi:MAG: heavy metal translocating P-type ATPase [Planctomycetes bacterium]|nr:heavy metal translocating P-type ATPase [Planctomycetota bacterium]